jgi:hypothetical protein
VVHNRSFSLRIARQQPCSSRPNPVPTNMLNADRRSSVDTWNNTYFLLVDPILILFIMMISSQEVNVICPHISQTRNDMLFYNNALAKCPRRMNAKLILPPQILSPPKQKRTIGHYSRFTDKFRFQTPRVKRACLT